MREAINDQLINEWFRSEIIPCFIWANNLLREFWIRISDTEEKIVTRSLFNYFYFQHCLNNIHRLPTEEFQLSFSEISIPTAKMFS